MNHTHLYGLYGLCGFFSGQINTNDRMLQLRSSMAADFFAWYPKIWAVYATANMIGWNSPSNLPLK